MGRDIVVDIYIQDHETQGVYERGEIRAFDVEISILVIAFLKTHNPAYL